MFITPISFNRANYRQTNFGISDKPPHKAPTLREINPGKIDEIIKRPEIFRYAEITVKSKKNDDTWRLIGCEGKTSRDALILLKKDGKEKTVSTKELCENYKDWRSLFIKGSIHPPVQTKKVSLPSPEISSDKQEILPPISEKFKRDTQFETIMKTLRPGEDTNRHDLFLYMAYFSPKEYSIRATMNDGTKKEISKVCLSHQGADPVPENMRIIFKPSRRDTRHREFMTFNQFYRNCASINFWKPDFTIGDDKD